MCHACKDQGKTVHAQHDQGERGRAVAERNPSGMKATVLVLLVTTLSSLYVWPLLYWSLFKWLLALVGLLGTLLVLAMKLHNVESFATQGELFHAVKTRDLPRATKLAKLAKLLKRPHEVDAGRMWAARYDQLPDAVV